MKIYQVDAFAQGPFTGNPAAVVTLDHWLDDAILLNIAAENNLSETAYFIPHKYEDETAIRSLHPDFSRLKSANVRGIIATAKGDKVDFISRCFYPGVGIDEDPATGSAHTSLTPYWANRLGKDHLVGRQLSTRIGYFDCELQGDRTILKGRGRLFLEGTIFI
ncbi:UNVERIFIED_CONTAM: hypothetical protein GTU68_028919 [Idotea baltica]|nr:hypothetical protein [Idotea baltica]